MNRKSTVWSRGKDHKQYEYGSKVSIASTAQGNLIVGVISHNHSQHDGHTLTEILRHVQASRGNAAKQAMCDHGYRGKGEVNSTKNHFTGECAQTRYALPGRQKAQTMQKTSSD